MKEIVIESPARNALGIEVMRGLIAQIEGAGSQPILLRGAGSTFSAGLNLKQVAALDPPQMLDFLNTLETMLEKLYVHPAPVVACINGHAIAGGCVLALCADLRVASDDPEIRIGLNEVALGLEFPPKLLKIVKRRIPSHLRERLLLEAGLYAPQTALRLGLVDELATNVEAAARAALAALAAHPAGAYAATKTSLRPSIALDAEEEAAYRTHLVPAWCTPEVKERVRAVLNRRA
jgi:Delta3-Delta2-enoyl-CoA isomerase